jgi:anti-sigma regulatory factor (Ser/Thr protein kinase)
MEPGNPSAEQAVDVTFGIAGFDVALKVPATEDSLPLIRQALRSLGETVGADPEALEDAELAVTEACANAIEHAYDEGGGDVWVALTPLDSALDVSVTDHGIGIDEFTERADGTRGYGLEMIRSIATSMEFQPGDGTDLRMRFAIGQAPVDGHRAAAEPAERMLRRLVAIVAAQRDMSTERVVEGLLVAEVVARHALRRLVGDRAHVRLAHRGRGFELAIGPLEVGGADAVVADSEVPVVGSVVARLADEVRAEDDDEGEFLVLRIDPH